jgi:hypothetical protein
MKGRTAYIFYVADFFSLLSALTFHTPDRMAFEPKAGDGIWNFILWNAPSTKMLCLTRHWDCDRVSQNMTARRKDWRHEHIHSIES